MKWNWYSDITLTSCECYQLSRMGRHRDTPPIDARDRDMNGNGECRESRFRLAPHCNRHLGIAESHSDYTPSSS